MGGSLKKTQAIYNFLRENPSASDFEIIEKFQCTPRTATRVRAAMRADGHNVAPHGDRKKIQRVLESDPRAEKELEKKIEEIADKPLEDISNDEMKMVLTEIIRNKKFPPQVRVAAIGQKVKLDYETQDRHALGPGAPLSYNDAVDRLSMLMVAVGPDLTHDAITKAFSKEKAHEKTVDPGQTPPDAPKPAESPGNTPPIQASNGSIGENNVG